MQHKCEVKARYDREEIAPSEEGNLICVGESKASPCSLASHSIQHIITVNTNNLQDNAKFDRNKIK